MSRLPIVAALLIAVANAAQGLCHNLEGAWNDAASGPFEPRLTFWSRASDDLLFSDGDEIEILCQAGVRSVALDWTVARNQFATPLRRGRAEALPGSRFRLRFATAGLRPGFYDVRVKLDSGKQPIEGVCVFGWRIADIPPPAPRPVDFAAFWRRGLDELRGVALAADAGEMRRFAGAEIDEYNVTHALLPRDFDPDGRRTDAVESCKISFAGVGGVRIHAWLAKPVGPGPFPALLVLPGAGFAARPRPLEHARHGYLAIDIQIHGQDVDLPGEYPKLPGYYDARYDPPERTYLRNVYLNAVQAVNYLASRPDVDATRIACAGGSQGGRLGIVVAALEPRVRAIVCAIPHGGNRAYQAWADACNRAGVDGMDRDGPPPRADDPAARGEAYIDPLDFCADVRCPAFVDCGLIDPASPPAHVWTMFRALGCADKTFVPLPALGHDWSAEFDRRALRWLDRVLANVAAPPAR